MKKRRILWSVLFWISFAIFCAYIIFSLVVAYSCMGYHYPDVALGIMIYGWADLWLLNMAIYTYIFSPGLLIGLILFIVSVIGKLRDRKKST